MENWGPNRNQWNTRLLCVKEWNMDLVWGARRGTNTHVCADYIDPQLPLQGHTDKKFSQSIELSKCSVNVSVADEFDILHHDSDWLLNFICWHSH